MNSIELNIENQIQVNLYCEEPIDLDLTHWNRNTFVL